MNDIQRMKELIEKITAADVAYFQKDAPIMSDMEYDKPNSSVSGIFFTLGTCDFILSTIS